MQATLVWIEKNAVETRLRDPKTGQMVREGGQKMVAATFRHDTSRNLDPQLHSHAVIANMVQGEDGKWRTMANEKLYESKMLIGAIYRSEFARGLGRIGYRVEKTHADGRFEIAGVPRPVVEAFSTRRAEIEAGMAERGMGTPSDNPRLAERAALVSRAAKRDIDRDELTAVWQRQAADLGFDARALTAEAAKGAERESAGGDGGVRCAGRARAGTGTGQRGMDRDAARSGGEHVLEDGTDMASSGRDRGTDSVPESGAHPARALGPHRGPSPLPPNQGSTSMSCFSSNSSAKSKQTAPFPLTASSTRSTQPSSVRRSCFASTPQPRPGARSKSGMTLGVSTTPNRSMPTPTRSLNVTVRRGPSSPIHPRHRPLQDLRFESCAPVMTTNRRTDDVPTPLRPHPLPLPR